MAVALPKYPKDINANLTNKGNGGIKWGWGQEEEEEGREDSSMLRVRYM